MKDQYGNDYVPTWFIFAWFLFFIFLFFVLPELAIWWHYGVWL